MREVGHDAREQLLLAPSFVDLGCAHAGCILKTRVRLRSNCAAWISCRASVVGEDGGFVCEEAIAVPPHGEAFLRVALVSELPGVRRGFLHMHCTPTGPAGEPLSEDGRSTVMPSKLFNRTTCALRALLEAPGVVVAPPDAVRFGTVAVDSNMVQPLLLHNPTSAPMLVRVRLNMPDGSQSPFSVWEQDPTPTLRAIARNRGDRGTEQDEAGLTPQSWLRSNASPAGARVILPPMGHHEAEAVTVWVAFAPSASRDAPSDLLQSEDYNFHQEVEVLLVGDVVAADGKVHPLRDASSGEPSQGEDDDFLASLLEAVPERGDILLAAIELEGTCSTPRLQVPRVMQAMVLQASPGTTAIRKIPVRNASRVPATVAVAIHSDSHAAGTSGFDVSPHQFDLGPMEVGEVAVHFSPPWPEADVAGKLSMTLLPNGTAYRLALRGQATSSSRPTTKAQEMDVDRSQSQGREAWGRPGDQLANGGQDRSNVREQPRAADLATGLDAPPPASTGDMGILADQTVVAFGSVRVKQQTTARLRLRPAETSPDLDLRLELQGDEAAVGFFSLQGSSAVSLHWPQDRAAGGASAQIGVADLWHGQELAVDLQYAPQSVAVHRATLMIKARARGAKRYTYRFRVPLLGVAGQSRMLLEGAQVVGGSGRDVPLTVAPTGGASPTQLLTLRGTDCEPHKTLEVKLQLRNAGDRAGFLLARCVDMRGKPVHTTQVTVRPSALVVGPQRRCSIQLALSSQAMALLAPERHGAQDAIFTVQLFVGDEVLRTRVRRHLHRAQRGAGEDGRSSNLNAELLDARLRDFQQHFTSEERFVNRELPGAVHRSDSSADMEAFYQQLGCLRVAVGVAGSPQTLMSRLGDAAPPMHFEKGVKSRRAKPAPHWPHSGVADAVALADAGVGRNVDAVLVDAAAQQAGRRAAAARRVKPPVRMDIRLSDDHMESKVLGPSARPEVASWAAAVSGVDDAPGYVAVTRTPPKRLPNHGLTVTEISPVRSDATVTLEGQCGNEEGKGGKGGGACPVLRVVTLATSPVLFFWFSFFSSPAADRRSWAASPAWLTIDLQSEGYFYITNTSDEALEFDVSTNDYVLSVAQPSGTWRGISCD
jgi:hypothetical protein